MSAEPSASTILSLPNEILLAIAAAGQEGRVPDPQTPFNLKSEWTLSQVCRRLRAAIIGSPSLWTLVEVNLDAEGSVETSKLYLERSGACNISATILQRSLLGDTERDLVRQLLRYMVPHVDRISWLRVELRMGLVLVPFRNLAALNLQHLEIARDMMDLSNECGIVEIFLPGTPKLVFVKMVRSTPFPAIPPWTASITHLELWGGVYAWGFLPEMMKQCPSLAYLHIDIRRFSAGLRLHIPSLKSLHVSVSDGEDTYYLLGVVNIFDTPALTELTLNHVHGDQICVLFNSTGFQSSFPVLSSLSFINTNACSCEDEATIFSTTITSPPIHLFPALSSLTLINQCFTHHIVHNIVGLSPWPLFKTLTLSPSEDAVGAVSFALQRAVGSERPRGLRPLPRFRFSQALFSELAMKDGLDLDQEIFDPEDVLDAFRST
ncbi:hypothetical protein DFH06DRAFT_746985 [Mycena polygramma]|nr:hypothetical protein DFH06DRAFT_746985 [Mycena polygramma]